MEGIVNWPKITVITPSYNQAPFIEETIKSVLDQGYPNLEYIIIDGGSTDGSKEIIQKYHNQLAFWVSEPDNGQYHAINKGFSRSTGDIMAWINSDDKLVMGSLFSVAEIFTILPQVEWITSSLPIVWNYKGRAIDCKKRPGYNRYTFSKGSNLPGGSWFAKYWIQQESTFWKRSLWEKTGKKINDSLKYAGDFDLWLRFFNEAELYSAQTLIGGFRIHAGQKTGGAMDQYLIEAKKCLEDHGLKPHSCVHSYFRNFLYYTLFSNPYVIEKFPFITTLLRKSQIAYLAPGIIWDGENWKIITQNVI